MRLTDFLFAFLFIIGLGYLIYIVVDDPIRIFRSLFRCFKPNTGKIVWRIIKAPFWIIILFFDYFFKLGIDIKHYTEVSKEIDFKYSNYDNVIIIETNNLSFIENQMRIIKRNIKNDNMDYDLSQIIFEYAIVNNRTYIKMKNGNFAVFKTIVSYLDNIDENSRIIRTRGILKSRLNVKDSICFEYEIYYSSILIGKDYRGRKLYVTINCRNINDSKYYYNSEIDKMSYFKLSKAIEEIESLNFNKWKIKLSA